MVASTLAAWKRASHAVKKSRSRRSAVSSAWTSDSAGMMNVCWMDFHANPRLVAISFACVLPSIMKVNPSRSSM